ncbi:MAG: LuxR C-terminal-related transcriptional regulator [Burkholderiaceae bacterium]
MAWLDSFALSGVLVGLNEPTLIALQQLHALALRRGDMAAAARARARQAGPLVGQLRHAEANDAIDDALALLAPLPPTGGAHALVWAAAGHQRMLERDYAQSIEQGRRAIALASELGESATLARAELATGAALLFVDLEAGRRMLLALRDRMRADGNLQGVATVLSMIGSGLGELMHLPDADAYLSEAVALAEAHDFNGVYPRAWLALCRMLTGRWEEAAGFATAVVSSEHDSSMSRLMALLALSRLRMRRGDPGADAVLDEALSLASGSGTLQRLAPTACARAEAAFVRGDLPLVRSEVERALPLALAKGHPWFVGELRYWLWRTGLGAPATDGCATPWALAMAGQWQEAAQAWVALGCPYEQARALAEGDRAAQRQALAIFEQLGAAPAAEALRRDLRDAGERGIARGARASTQGHPAGLTRAEQQVLGLMAQALRNAEIAARIHRSVRTVDHHVAAVLAKLGVDSRQAAVQRAQREGWVGPGTSAI